MQDVKPVEEATFVRYTSMRCMAHQMLMEFMMTGTRSAFHATPTYRNPIARQLMTTNRRRFTTKAKPSKKTYCRAKLKSVVS